MARKAPGKQRRLSAPETAPSSPAPPNSNLRLAQLDTILNITRTTREWTQDIRRFFPIQGKNWVSSADAGPMNVVLNDAVRLEKLLNPHAGNQACPLEERFVIWKVVGAEVRWGRLMAAVRRLIDLYDMVVDYYGWRRRLGHWIDQSWGWTWP
jgi:hypothetical protein